MLALKYKTIYLSVALATSVISLSGCNSDNDKLENSSFSLGISDAPVDGLSQVVICFHQVELLGGPKTTLFTVGEDTGVLPANNDCKGVENTVGIDLLQYTGDNSISLISNVDVEAGEYTQLRLMMSEGSYAVAEDDSSNPVTKIPVKVPSNELKLDGFTVAQGGSVAFTLEFDLRKSMVDPNPNSNENGQQGYFVKPRGVRLVDDNEVGTLFGSVSDAFITGDCGIGSPGPDMNLAAVYIYSGNDAGVAFDITLLEDNTIDDKAIAPLASAIVSDDGAGNYGYEIGFVPAGDYTVAITCNTEDDPEFDNPNTIQNPDLGDAIVFIETKVATVPAQGDAEASFGN